MSYSNTERASCSRVAACALLAVSAGACVGAALSPVASSMYAAPVASRTVTAARPVVYATRGNVQPAAMQNAQAWEQVQESSVQTASIVNVWAVASGGLFAAAAAMAAVLYRGQTASEEVAMLAVFGTKKAAPKAAVKQVERPLWYPTAQAPEWLDGSLPGDRGFDPLGLSKPTEYIQFDLDQLDQNSAVNVVGGPIGRVQSNPDEVSTDALQPYSEVFGLQRFRECELIHGRWAMMAVLGCLVSEPVTGVAWQNAGLVEATSGATYWGSSLPFTGTQLVWFEVLSMGFVEVFRNTELDLEKRCYPGGAFDPLGLTTKDEATTFRLKEAELKHGRLAMIAFLGFAAAAGRTGLGATQAFGEWASGFN